MASIWKKLQEKYIVSIRNQESFFESSKATLSGYEMFSILLLGFLLTLSTIFLLFKYTDLGLLVSRDHNKKMKLVELNEKADSLENSLQLQQNYISNIHKIMNGESIESVDREEIDSQQLAQINISDPTAKELALRDMVNSRDQFSITNATKPLNILSFTAPVEGVLSSSYEEENNHFGVDILAPKNTPIKAVANGRVLYSSWNVEDGYAMIILHENEFISIYKHAEKLLKEINETVEAGDAIAIIGNSGENTTGYHLHFELWKSNFPVNPEEYIKFEI